MQKSNADVSIFKAIADETRLKIVELLCNGEMCACDILESFQITQPTLSYHMKTLTDCGLVVARKDGSWMRYRLNGEQISALTEFWNQIATQQKNILSKENKEASKCESS